MRPPLPPSESQLAAIRAQGWPWKLPETWTEAEDLLRELWADGD